MNCWSVRSAFLCSMLLCMLTACGGGGGQGGSTIAAPSALSYQSPKIYTVNIAITTLTPTVAGTVTNYSVSPALPVGLVLNTTSGQITGTPTVAVVAANYTITAQNSAGSTTFALSITVNSATLTLSSSAPANNATDAERTTTPSLTFSASLDGATVAGNVTLNRAGQTVAATANTSGRIVTLTAQQELMPLATYTMTASIGLRGSGGEQLSAPVSTSFTIRDGAWQVAQLIETANAGDALDPQIAFDASGNALAVWDQFDGTRKSIYANRYTAGSGWGVATILETDDTGDALDPQLAFDANGNALAVWYQYDGTHNNVYSNRYTAGKGWGVAVLVSNTIPVVGGAINPRIAIDAAGNVLTVWTQYDGSTFNIWANRYSAATAQWGIATRVETANAGTAAWPQIAVDRSGNALAVWMQSDGTRLNIWANRYTASGNSWGTDMLIETDNASDALLPQIAIDANGNALAVWEQSDGTRYNVWANRYTAGSNSWSTATLIEADNAGNALDPQIAIDAHGNALAIWKQYDGSRDHVWANRFTAGSSSWGTATLVESDNTGDASYPQITFDANGNALAVWAKHDGRRFNIWANRYVANSNSWRTATLVETDNAGDATNPQVAIDANGNALAIWEQSDSAVYNIWANRFR